MGERPARVLAAGAAVTVLFVACSPSHRQPQTKVPVAVPPLPLQSQVVITPTPVSAVNNPLSVLPSELSLPPTTARSSAPSTSTTAPDLTGRGGTDPAFEDARIQWVAAQSTDPSSMGLFWSKAVADLAVGEHLDADTTNYPAAVEALQSLLSIPVAQLPPSPGATGHADIVALNQFFGTPGAYGT